MCVDKAEPTKVYDFYKMTIAKNEKGDLEQDITWVERSVEIKEHNTYFKIK